MPRSPEFLCNFKHHQEWLFSLKQVNKRHPRVLAENFRLKVGQEHACNAYVLTAVSFPQGRDNSGENPLLGCVGDHPRGDLAQVRKRRAGMKAESTVCHGNVGTHLVCKITYTSAVGRPQKTKARTL